MAMVVRILPLLLVLSACGAGTGLTAGEEAPAAGLVDTRGASSDFEHEGSAWDLRFRYPSGWSVATEGESVFLTNFELGARCCHLDVEDLKADFYRDTRPGQTLDSVRREICESGWDGAEVRSCSIQERDGRDWLVAHTYDTTLGAGHTLARATLDADTLYTVFAFVIDGPGVDGRLDVAERILDTLRLAPAHV